MAVKFSREVGKGLTNNEGGDAVQESAFSVEIANLTIGGINKVEGLDVQREVINNRDGEGSVHVRASMGNKQIITIKLFRDLSTDPAFYNWFKTGMDGKVQRNTITFTSFTDTHEAASQIHVFECWAKSYEIGGLDATSNAHAFECIEVVGEDIKYA